MQPDPGIAQQQRDPGKQQPPQRIAGGGADASPLHLAIAGLDAESPSVGLSNPRDRTRVKSPVGIDQGATAMLSLPASVVPAADADLHGRPWSSSFSTAPGMTSPAAALLLEEPPRAGAGLALVAWRSSGRLHRHQERCASRLQVTHDFGTEKAAI